jgi:hypothetical protein
MLQHIGKALANITACVACLRPLGPNEVRQGVIDQARSMIRKDCFFQPQAEIAELLSATEKRVARNAMQ